MGPSLLYCQCCYGVFVRAFFVATSTIRWETSSEKREQQRTARGGNHEANGRVQNNEKGAKGSKRRRRIGQALLGHARDVQRGARGEGQGERPAAPGRCDRSQYGRPARRRGATTASRSKDVRGATSHPRSVNTKRALSMGVPMSSSHMSWHGARRRCGLVSSALATCRSPSQLHHSTQEAAATPHPRLNRAAQPPHSQYPLTCPENSCGDVHPQPPAMPCRQQRRSRPTPHQLIGMPGEQTMALTAVEKAK